MRKSVFLIIDEFMKTFAWIVSGLAYPDNGKDYCQLWVHIDIMSEKHLLFHVYLQD